MPSWELGLASLVVFELALLLAWQSNAGGGLASPPFRALLVAPPTFGLAAYFGASLGYLLWGGGRQADLSLGYEALVGRRFLLSKASPALSMVTTISVIGVALGVWLMTVSLGILAGFEADLRQKFIGANAHATLQHAEKPSFTLHPEQVSALEATPGLVAAAPYVEGEVAIASSNNYTGAQLFGVDPARSTRVLSVLDTLHRGKLDPLEREMRGEPAEEGAGRANAEVGQNDTARDEGLEDGEPDEDDDIAFVPPAPTPGIVIGVEMAKTLGVTVGDRVRVISPLLEVLTPVGVAPRSQGFEVAAVFSSKMYEYDARFVYTSLPAARRFFRLEDAAVSGLHLRTVSPESSLDIAAQTAANAGDRFVAHDWTVRNRTLFAALKLERVVAFVVLVFIILVASFSIVNTLTMSVIEKRQEIAILKTMGARDISVMKVFLVQGMLVGLFGVLLGVLAALGTVFALERFGFWIPDEVYYIDSLPVHLEMLDVALVLVAATLIVWDFAVFPALRGARLTPIEGLRDG
jgi:lipoprotein-releasing system permease protein